MVEKAETIQVHFKLGGEDLKAQKIYSGANVVYFGDSLTFCKVMSYENMTLPNKVNNYYERGWILPYHYSQSEIVGVKILDCVEFRALGCS